MWLRSQDKTKLVNLRNIEHITISKSYGSKDNDGNKLNSAIVIQYSPSSVTSMGLYKNTEDAMRIMGEIEKFLENNEENVFQMP